MGKLLLGAKGLWRECDKGTLSCGRVTTYLLALEELQEPVQRHDLWNFPLGTGDFPEVFDLLCVIHVAHPYLVPILLLPQAEMSTALHWRRLYGSYQVGIFFAGIKTLSL